MSVLAAAAAGMSVSGVCVGVGALAAYKLMQTREGASRTEREVHMLEAWELRLQKERAKSEIRQKRAVDEALNQAHEERRRKWMQMNRDYPCPDFLKPYITNVAPDRAMQRRQRRYVNIGVVGDSGTGKSSLIKGILNLVGATSKDGGTGTSRVPHVGFEGDGTLEATPYTLSAFRDVVTVWDLPGNGTLRFPSRTYLLDVGLKYYDVLLVVTGGRWSENNAHVLQAIKDAELPYLIVRTKVDQAIEAGENDEGLTCEETLMRVRTSLQDHVSERDPSRIHLVTARERHWESFGSVRDLWTHVLQRVEKHW